MYLHFKGGDDFCGAVGKGCVWWWWWTGGKLFSRYVFTLI